jgi:hypothetical protein
LFLSEFIDFEIECREGDYKFPFELKRNIFGVEFFALMSAEGIADLEQSMPEQFGYISKKLQEESA